MKRELEQKLINDFPELYIEHNEPPTKSLMCFGMDVEDGWYDIVYALSRCITYHVESRINREIVLRENLKFGRVFDDWKKGWKSKWWYRYVWKNIKEYKRLLEPLDIDSMRVRAVQVKEKFGGLRFYIHGADDEVFGMIEMAEMMSYVTCEKCGHHGKMHRRGSWLKTLCTKCAKPLEYEPCKEDEEES